MQGERLKQAREAKGLTQRDLAAACGFSRNSIVNWEGGKRAPKTTDLETMARILGTSVGFLMGGDEAPPAHRADPPEAPAPVGGEAAATPSFAYWGEVLDRAKQVAARGDPDELDVVIPLIGGALGALMTASRRISSLVIEEDPAGDGQPGKPAAPGASRIA